MIEPEGEFDAEKWAEQNAELRKTLDAANRSLIEQHEVRAFGHDTPLRVFPVGPPDVPVTHFLDVGHVTADGLVDPALDEPVLPFNRGGLLPSITTSFPYDPDRDGPIIPAALVREHGDRAVRVLLERDGERILLPAMTVASHLERPGGRHELVFTTETREQYRARLARELVARQAATWAARDRIRARRRARRGRR